MRRTGFGLLVFAALLFCTLIAGTPVNNDASPAAEVAGIHLTTSPGHAREVQASVTVTLAALLVVAFIGLGHAALAGVLLRRGRAPLAARSVLRSRSETRRGPPSLLAW